MIIKRCLIFAVQVQEFGVSLLVPFKDRLPKLGHSCDGLTGRYRHSEEYNFINSGDRFTD